MLLLSSVVVVVVCQRLGILPWLWSELAFVVLWWLCGVVALDSFISSPVSIKKKKKVKEKKLVRNKETYEIQIKSYMFQSPLSLYCI